MEERQNNTLKTILIIIGAVAAVAGIAYAVYRFFFKDEFEDFDEDYYLDEDELDDFIEEDEK